MVLAWVRGQVNWLGGKAAAIGWFRDAKVVPRPAAANCPAPRPRRVAERQHPVAARQRREPCPRSDENELHLSKGDKDFSMRVDRFSTLDELAPYADDWDRLASGVPFRTWAWMSCWWRHYGQAQDRRRVALSALGVFDTAGRLVGMAPWYLSQSAACGAVLRWLGSGEVCSDYLGILAQPGMEDGVTAALADYLTNAAAPRDLHWDLLELGGVDACEPSVTWLIEHLAQRDCLAHFCHGPNCWRLDLPATWDDYLGMLSKSHRKQARRLQRRSLESGRAVLHTVQSARELPRACEVLVGLHQARRRALGQRGCFASPRFTAFHREVMPRLLSQGQLQLHWLELDGRPVAAEYHFASAGIVYAYQAGIEPAALAEEPGRLIALATLRRAIEQGYRAVDFLRGDEPYKAHFRAVPRPSIAVRVVPHRAAARLRHCLWSAAKHVKRLVKPR
jgi:CelD/BcsL family acetyltransferase involved in cellulose biosynthesis